MPWLRVALRFSSITWAVFPVNAAREILFEMNLELTRETSRDYQPQNEKSNTQTEGSGVSNVLRHHMVGLTGFEPATP